MTSGAKMAYETEKSESYCQERSVCQSTVCGPQANDTILGAMKDKLLQSPGTCRSEPFCVMDLGYVYKEYQRWTGLLPDVKPFYGLFPK